MEIIEDLNGDNIINAFSLRRFSLAIEITEVLGRVLNEVHGVNYSQRFWELLLWQYAGITITQHRLYNNPSFNYPPGVEEVNGLKPPSFKEKVKRNTIKLIKRVMVINSFKLTAQLLKTENELSIGFHDLKIIEEELGKAIPNDNLLFFVNKGNTSLRAKANAIADKQEDVFYRNAIRRIPKLYIEYFEQILSGIALIAPKKKVFHTHLLLTYNKFIVALYREHGAKIYWYQHGAFYGEVEGGGHNIEGRLADEFRSWGWKIHANNRPWKAYRLEKFSQQYRRSSAKKEFDLLICFPDLGPENERSYREKSDYLLGHISKEKYKKFLARPRPLNKLFSHAHKIAFIKDKRVVIDSGRSSMPEIIAKCRAVIQFSVPGTNFLECIYVDHPTIGLLENDQPTDMVKPHYDFLLKVGVLHNSFESLVDHLNNINIEEWWAAVTSMDGYKDFKDTFTRKV